MNNTEIKTRLTAGVAVIYPGPYLNQLRGEKIEDKCQEFLNQGFRSIVVNFAETELINSIGISILLGVIEAVNNAKGVLMLSNLSVSNRELFEVLGLMSHIAVADTEEAALNRLASKAEMAAR